jgi:hypothetical protein
MYEINGVIWPALYAYTGWLWGAAFGWSVAGGIAGFVLGVLVGALMMHINPYGPELLAILLALVLPWFLDAETWRWTVLALCAVPLPRLALGLALKKSWW